MTEEITPPSSEYQEAVDHHIELLVDEEELLRLVEFWKKAARCWKWLWFVTLLGMIAAFVLLYCQTR